jgi:3'(2'), 5'-bisphosphate nucleotidase
MEAGNAILQVYHSADFEVEKKADSSPLTLADRRSHEIIVDGLAGFDIPILSEEGQTIAYEDRKVWQTFFLIDPLDGTKEFIKKNGEFTVNIAIISKNRPVAGVVFVPDQNILYFAADGVGSFRADTDQIVDRINLNSASSSRFSTMSDSEATEVLSQLIRHSTRLPVKQQVDRPFTIAGSRSHSTPDLDAFVAQKRTEYGQVEFISAGSSLKLCLVAEGRADIYPRTGPTMEWDTAAGQAVVESSGGQVYQYDTTEPLNYNKENLRNPWFVVCR